MFKQLTQTTRLCRSRFTSDMLIQTLNTVYGYYSGGKKVSDAEAKRIMLEEPEYTGPLHPAQLEFDNNQTF